MKKRIIATMLVVIMTLMCFVGCASAFSFADEDLSDYVEFNLAKFKEALQKIEIEDGDFTTNEDIRNDKVKADIYGTIADAYIKAVSTYSFDKLETGDIGEDDVVYYCYYAKDANGKVYYRSAMMESTITASSTSKDHVIRLSDYDEDDELKALIADAILAKEGVKYYSMMTASALKADGKEIKVGANDVIVVSYEVTVTNADQSTTTNVVKYETLDLKDGSALANALCAYIAERDDASNTNTTKPTITVGSTVSVPHETSGTITSFTVGDKSYKNFKVDYLVDSYVSEADAITVTYKPFDKDTQLEPDSLHVSGAKETLTKDSELTYYIYPVYRLDVPESNAESVMEYAYGSKITLTTFELFEDESYKNGDKTVKALVEEVIKLYKKDFADGDDLDTKLKAYEAAEKAYEDADENAENLDELEAALDTAKDAFNKAHRDAIRAKFAEIAAAKSGEKTAGTELFAKYEKDIRHELTESYNEEITEAVEKAVYELIFENDEIVKVKAYPEKLLKDFAKHLYEAYEHDFYKEKHTAEGSTTSSNVSEYSYHNADFEAYLLEHTGASKSPYNGDIDKAIEDEAKASLAPLLKLYAVAKGIEADTSIDVGEVVEGYVHRDIDAGAYDAHYENDDKLSESENAKKKQEAEDKAEDNKEEALANAGKFLVTDEVFKEYKKSLGNKSYEYMESQYGEINIRASIQANRLFYYLVSTDVKVNTEDGHAHTEPVYTEADAEGNIYLKFRTVKYTIKADAE